MMNIRPLISRIWPIELTNKFDQRAKDFIFSHIPAGMIPVGTICVGLSVRPRDGVEYSYMGELPFVGYDHPSKKWDHLKCRVGSKYIYMDCRYFERYRSGTLTMDEIMMRSDKGETRTEYVLIFRVNAAQQVDAPESGSNVHPASQRHSPRPGDR